MQEKQVKKPVRISIHIMLGYLCIAVIIFILGAVSTVSLSSTKTKADEVYFKYGEGSGVIGTMLNHLMHARIKLNGALLNADNLELRDLRLEEFNEYILLTGQTVASLVEYVEDDPVAMDYINKGNALFDDYILAAERINDSLDAGNVEEAKSIINGEAASIGDQINNICFSLLTYVNEEGIKENEALSAEIGFSTGLVIALVFICIGLSVAVAFVSIRLITNSLRTVVGGLEEVSNTIDGSSEQLKETSEHLADGSTRQAASIEETSATMNETASMIAQNAENTRQAAQLSEKAMDSSVMGMKKMDEMVASMKELKESSDMISKIIKTIEEISFQTNLLAINATIEAAQAGDAGRGFAVVADEVRNLAQRSARAANETTDIIQKNINLTNLGMSTSQEVADSLRDINSQFANLNSIIDEINAASEEQSKGIRQINDAMSEMEKVTQVNAASAEESAAAANGLADETGALRGQISNVYALIQKDDKAGTASSSSSVRRPPSAQPARSATPAPRRPQSAVRPTQFSSSAPQTPPTPVSRVNAIDQKNSELERIIPLEDDNDF